MKKASAILLLFAALLLGDTQVSLEDNLVLVDASSAIPVMPDAVLLRFNIEIFDSSGTALLANANKRVKEIKKALRKAGFDDPCAMCGRSISITSYHQDSQRRYRIDPPGFFLLVEPHRADKAVDVLQKLSSKDRSLHISCNDIRFLVTDVTPYITELREQAFAQARRDAEGAVLPEGRQVGQLLAARERHPSWGWSQYTKYHTGGPGIDDLKPLSPLWLGYGLQVAYGQPDSAEGADFEDEDFIPFVTFNRTSITALGQSSILVVPDAVSLHFEIIVWDDIGNSVEVFAKTNRFYAEIREALEKNGILSLATLDDTYYITPETYGAETTFRIDHYLYLTLNDPSRVDRAISVVESMSEPEEGKQAFIGWVEYKVTDLESYLPKLREMAFKDARTRAEEAAGFYGGKAGEIKGWHEARITPGDSWGHYREWDVAEGNNKLPRMWLSCELQATYKLTRDEE